MKNRTPGFKEAHDHTAQGNAGLGCAIGYFTSKGHTVCLPLTDTQPYDLIVDIEGELKKIQVKTTYSKYIYEAKHGRSEAFVVGLAKTSCTRIKTTRKTFDPKSCDFLFVLCDDGTMYLIPSEHNKCKHSIMLGDKYSCFIVRDGFEEKRESKANNRSESQLTLLLSNEG